MAPFGSGKRDDRHGRGQQTPKLTLRPGDPLSPTGRVGEPTHRGNPVPAVDRVDGGDALSAASIFANLEVWDGQRAVDFAMASGPIAHTFHSDFNLASVEEVEQIA